MTKSNNILDDIVSGITNISKGMGTVAQQAGRDPVSTSYPDEMPTLYGKSRHRLALNVNPETGEHLCIGCKQCERVCPDSCITVIPSPDEKAKVKEFYIDQGLCMFCGLCTEVCPTGCIINTTDFEMSDNSRESLIYDIKRLTLTREQSEFYHNFKEVPLPKSKLKPKPKAPATASTTKPTPKSEPEAKPTKQSDK